MGVRSTGHSGAAAELNILGSWTNRYAPIQSVANGSVTMVQPAWAENTWGYDTVQSPYRQGPIYVENDYTLLDQPGEWYQDTTAGVLYCIPLSGQSMSTADVELPELQLLLTVGGTYDKPAHDLTFTGVTFSLYPVFEATRPAWHQMPTAIQVSAAANVSFTGDRFVDLGSVGPEGSSRRGAATLTSRPCISTLCFTLNVTREFFVELVPCDAETRVRRV